MISKFVALLRKRLAEDREQVVHRLAHTERLGNDIREALVQRNLTLEWVERTIDALYKADEDQLEEMEDEGKPESPPESESDKKIRRAIRRRAGTWGAS